MQLIKRRLRFLTALPAVVVGCAAAYAAVGTSPASGGNPAAPSAQVALDWNGFAVNAVRAATTMDGVPAGGSPRTLYQIEGLIYMSYEQAAVYDAVTKIMHRYVPYNAISVGAGDASPEAAVVEAAYDTLKYYLGDPKGTLASEYNASLAKLPNDMRTQRGLAVGAAAAADIERLRAGDGRNAPTSAYGVPGPVQAGQWQVVPPATVAQTPWVAFMKPFMLANPSRFRLTAPLSLTSSEYATELNELEAYGSATSTARTADETATAWFWNANAINQYDQLFRDVATQHNMDLVDTVHLLAAGDMTAADAGIACFDSKYTYLNWRPFTAIRNADIDGNAATTADPNWVPLLSTPNHPEYPAAHGCLTSAVTDVIANVLGTPNIDVTIWGANAGSSALQATRHFDTVKQVQDQVIDARVWAGLHFRSSVVAGESLGNQVAGWVLARYFKPVRDDD
ncbi:MAG: vanadium-dependent haloperoxidase [Gaiellaceae bacterium]